MNFKKTWERANEGFTLVELIVVIAILAILAGIAVPAYSGYIKKANKAADMQVLAAVNTAFAAACLENNKDINEFNNREARVVVTSDGTISSVTPYFEDFQNYFDVASNKFKVIRELVFVKSVGFKDAGEGATVSLPFGGSVTLSATQKDLIKQSNLSNDLGGVLTQVDGVGGTVAELLNSVGEGVSERVVGAFMADEDNLRRMITNLGYTVDENTSLVEQYIAAVDGFTDDYAKKQLADKYGADIDVNDDKYFDEYNNLVESTKAEAEKNLLVLGIAQSAVGQNASDVKAVINGGNLKENLVNSMMGEDSAAGMGTTALIYAAFTGYANSNVATPGAKDAVANTSDPTAVFDYLDDPAALKAFQDYMNSPEGSTDLDASIEAMDIINKTSSDQNAVGGILTNGFANKEFVGAIESLLK